MNFHHEEHVRLRNDILTRVLRRFRLRFALFNMLDFVVVAFCAVLCLLNISFGLILLACTVPRLVIGWFVMLWKGSVIKLYTKITFHRTDPLRRFATSTQHPYLAAWIALSYLSAALVLLMAIVIGIAIITVSFDVGFTAGVGSLVAEGFTVGVAFYMVITERAMYSFCVIGVVDDVLDSQDELRTAFVKVSSLLHIKRIDDLFNMKPKQSLLNRSGGDVAAHNAQAPRRHKAPNRKDN